MELQAAVLVGFGDADLSPGDAAWGAMSTGERFTGFTKLIAATGTQQAQATPVVTPSQILSEANLDLLALLVFVSVAQEAATRGQARVLVLDDVLQSIDPVVRRSLVDYLLTSLDGWQLIFTAHDALWRRRLRAQLLQVGVPLVEVECKTWNFESGPTIVTPTRDDLSPLRNAMLTGDVGAICAEAGLLQEFMCNELSCS